MLGQIGAVWCNLVQIRPWLVQTGAVWCKLVQTGAHCCRLLKFGAIWWRLVQLRSCWCSLVQLDAFCCMLVHLDVYWCSLEQFGAMLRQIGTDWYNLVQIMYDSSLFSLSRLVRLVQPCSMNVGMFFGLSTLVRLVQPALCMLVFYSVLVRCYP